MKASFLIAEEVRTEINNKLTVIGLYSGDLVIIFKGERPADVPEDTPIALERLTVLITIKDAPEGIYKCKGKITSPSGEAYNSDVAFGEILIKKDFNHTVVIELKPFIVDEPGKFKLDFYVNDEMFTYTFEIQIQDQA